MKSSFQSSLRSLTSSSEKLRRGLPSRKWLHHSANRLQSYLDASTAATAAEPTPIPQLRPHHSPSVRRVKSNSNGPSPAENARPKNWRTERTGYAPGGKPEPKQLGAGKEQSDLQETRDRKVFMEYVEALLRKRGRAVALEAVILRSRSANAVSSWGKIIEYDLKQGKVALAFKTFNDVRHCSNTQPCFTLTELQMKKRGQMPDEYTFVTLFRGLARNATLPTASRRAEELYMSLRRPNSPVKPNLKFANATMDVCGRAGDSDAMFRIAVTLPEGNEDGAADVVTYETIIRGLLRQVQLKSTETGQLYELGLQGSWQKQIMTGRKVWGNVIDRWHKGNLKIDARLVYSMGLLLSYGTEKDVDDILTLIEQTTGQRRLLPAIGDSKRPTHFSLKRPKASVISDVVQGAEETPETNHKAERDEPDSISPGLPSGTELASVFDPLPESSRPEYVKPNNPILSQALLVCERFRALREGQEYWDQLTATLQPDLNNYHGQLRLLRTRSASTLVTELVHSMVDKKAPGGLEPLVTHETFSIAMGACEHDHRNVASIRNALSLLSLAKQTLDHPDQQTLQCFVDFVERRKKSLTADEVIEVLEALHEIHLSVVRRVALTSETPSPPRPALGTRHKDGASYLLPAKSHFSLEELNTIIGMTHDTSSNLVSLHLQGLSPSPVKHVRALQRIQREGVKNMEQAGFIPRSERRVPIDED